MWVWEQKVLPEISFWTIKSSFSGPIDSNSKSLVPSKKKTASKGHTSFPRQNSEFSRIHMALQKVVMFIDFRHKVGVKSRPNQKLTTYKDIIAHGHLRNPINTCAWLRLCIMTRSCSQCTKNNNVSFGNCCKCIAQKIKENCFAKPLISIRSALRSEKACLFLQHFSLWAGSQSGYWPIFPLLEIFHVHVYHIYFSCSTRGIPEKLGDEPNRHLQESEPFSVNGQLSQHDSK